MITDFVFNVEMTFISTDDWKGQIRWVIKLGNIVFDKKKLSDVN